MSFKQEKRKSQIFSKKLLAYSATATAALALTNVDAEIVYQEVNAVMPDNVTYEELQLVTEPPTDVLHLGFSSSSTYRWAYMYPMMPNLQWIEETFHIGPGEPRDINGKRKERIAKRMKKNNNEDERFGPLFPKNLPDNHLVGGDPSDQWGNSIGLIGSAYSSSTYFGHFVDTNREFIGIRFTIGENTHYGWVRVSLNANVDRFEIHDWAYEDEADTPILTGDMGVCIWNGSADTNWNNPLNWNANRIPTQNDNVNISSMCPNYPEITNDVACNSLQLERMIINRNEEAGEIYISAEGSLNINGSLTIEDGSVFSNSGIINFRGNDSSITDLRTEKTSIGNVKVETLAE